MARGFDAIVGGGGHNGLTAAAYLTRAGLSVCVLERRPLLGGACVTEELWPGHLLELLREGARSAGLRQREVHDLYRVMTMPVGELLEEWFTSDVLKGGIASTGVVGVWAGPRTPGTSYNLLHHWLGELDGVVLSLIHI